MLFQETVSARFKRKQVCMRRLGIHHWIYLGGYLPILHYSQVFLHLPLFYSCGGFDAVDRCHKSSLHAQMLSPYRRFSVGSGRFPLLCLCLRFSSGKQEGSLFLSLAICTRFLHWHIDTSGCFFYYPAQKSQTNKDPPTHFCGWPLWEEISEQHVPWQLASLSNCLPHIKVSMREILITYFLFETLFSSVYTDHKKKMEKRKWFKTNWQCALI